MGMGIEMTYVKKQSLTAAGLQKLRDELDELKNVKRKDVIARVKASRCFGLIENTDYQTAREDQGFIEGRILTLENILQNAEVIDQSKLNEKIIEIGHTVLVRELPDGENETFSIVGSAEVDPLEGKISPESPIAKQMLGKQVGDEIKVKTPNGEMLFLIVSIS